MKRITLLIGAVAAGALVLYWWKSVPAPVASGVRQQPIPDHRVLREESPVACAFDSLPAIPRPAASMQMLSELKKNLQSMPKDVALKWIRGFLDS